MAYKQSKINVCLLIQVILYTKTTLIKNRNNLTEKQNKQHNKQILSTQVYKLIYHELLVVWQ